MTGPVLNHTTSVGTERTVAEVHRMLADSGAAHVVTQYSGGLPVGVTIVLGAGSGSRAFRLPVRPEAMGRLLRREWEAGRIRSTPRGGREALLSNAHAHRVAWRVVRDWLAAQLAIVAAEQAELEQVLLPYLLVDGDETTLYDRYLDQGRRALEASD